MRLKSKRRKTRAMSQSTTSQSVEAPSSEDTALMTRLGLLLGEHRVSTVKTQAYHHPILSHQNSNICFPSTSTERRKKSQYTTSPASTLSDKGIGSSVGSFDSEFRNNLSALAETSAPSNRTGSLDCRGADIASHSRTDSGIPNHSRSSSDIILAENTSDVSKPRLAQQCEEKLWNGDPRRNSGNVQTLPYPVGKARKESEKSTDTVNSIDAMKLPQLYSDSPAGSKEPSIHSSMSSSRSLTPAASVCEVAIYKNMKRSLSSYSNGTAVFEPDALPPPPPPPLSHNYYDDYNELPPPPPPPPITDDVTSINSRASSSDRTLSCEDFHQQDNNHFLRPASPNFVTRASPQFYQQTAPNMVQMLRGSPGLARSTPIPRDDPRMAAKSRQWPPNDQEIARHQLESGMRAIDLAHTRRSSTNSPYSVSGVGVWDQLRPHSLSTPPLNLSAQNLPHKSSMDFDNNGFSNRANSVTSTLSNERRKPLSNASSTSEMKNGRAASYRLPGVNLHYPQFDLPWAVTSESKFVGREWLFGEIANSVNSTKSPANKGVVIYGKKATGKTSIIHQLDAYSHNGPGKLAQYCSSATLSKFANFGASLRPGASRVPRHLLDHSNSSSRNASPAFGTPAGKPGSRNGSQSSLSCEEVQKKLWSQVVATHYCQADNNTTCYVPEFLHSIVAQLVQAPQLTAYREYLLQQPRLLSLLSIGSCVQNPSLVLKKAILEPLFLLRQNHKLPRISMLILIDGLGEAELHRPDHGHSILTLLQCHLAEFPDFLKVVATCRTEDKNLLGDVPLFDLSIDYEETNANVAHDIQTYIAHRITTSKCLSNLTLMGKPDTATTQKLLASHLSSKCEGSMLYLRLTLDLLESGKLVPKSSGFKVVPVNLSEAFLLMCNLRFTSASSFVRVRDIVAVALASLYPLNDEQIYQAIVSGYVSNELPFDEFQRLMDSVSQFLVVRSSDGGRSFLHPCFREWLTHGNTDDNQVSTYSSTKKFSVDPKHGHALLATVLSRQPQSRLNAHAALELAHHLLKARLFRGQSKTTGINSNDLHAYWMAQCSGHLSDSLSAVRNLFYPNIKVSKLLLHSGANPNSRSQVLCEAPVICVAAHVGSIEFVQLLLSYGASVNMPAANGMTCLAYAAAAGHEEVVRLLLSCKPSPRLDLVDRNSHSPLLHAISRNHINVALLLLTCEIYVSPEQRKFSAIQAFIAAATTGCIELLEYLLDHGDAALRCEVDSIDPTRGESALTAAASRGKEAICEHLVCRRRANIEQRNGFGMTPLMCAVKQGRWETVALFLNMGSAPEGADSDGRTPLTTAASLGHAGVLELLLSKGASIHSVDKQGLTALGYAALNGHLHCVRSLVDRGSDVRHPDKHGRTPLDLASYSGHEQIVDLLLDAGAEFSRVEFNNMTPLARAIVNQNPSTVALLLKRGATVTDAEWKLAFSSPRILAVLLEKGVDDANALYKDGKILEAREVYSSVLRHVKEPDVTQQKTHCSDLAQDVCEFIASLLLGLARCSRKLSEFEQAELSSSRALELKPCWYEALYVRARVRRETQRLSDALGDVEEAAANAPVHNAKEVKKLLERIQEEMRKNGDRKSTSESPENSRRTSLPKDPRRPRVSSMSRCNVNDNNDDRSVLSSSQSFAYEMQTAAESCQTQSQKNGFVRSQAQRHFDHLPYFGQESKHFSGDLIPDYATQSALVQHRPEMPISAYPYPQHHHVDLSMQGPGSATPNQRFKATSYPAVPNSRQNELPFHRPKRCTVATEL